VPSLDLRFADNKSLVDATTGANLVTFTRASSGTYVGSDGVLRTAVTNLLVRSEEFDNASWTKSRATVTANATSSPAGTLTADALIEDTSVSLTHLTRADVTVAVNTVYAISVFAKSFGRTRFRLDFSDASTSADTVFAIFDLAAGTVASSSVGGNGTLTSASIVPYTNGWYQLRCYLYCNS
jgi:hypothetical protein